MHFELSIEQYNKIILALEHADQETKFKLGYGEVRDEVHRQMRTQR